MAGKHRGVDPEQLELRIVEDLQQFERHHPALRGGLQRQVEFDAVAVKHDGEHDAAVGLLDHLHVAGDGALVGMAAPVDRALVQVLEALAGILVRRGHGGGDGDMLERLLRGPHSGLALMPVEPHGGEQRVAVDVDGVGRILKHAAALAVALHGLTGHRLAGRGPEGSVATQK